MKILFFINHLADGGAEHVASALLNHLCKKHETTLVLFSNKKATYNIDNKILTQKIIADGKFKIIRAIKRILKINGFIKKNEYDLIISFLTYTNIYVLIANIFIGRKIIISERNTLKRQQSKIIQLLRKILYPKADKIVFVTKSDCKQFNAPQKSTTIYNPSLSPPFANYTNRQTTIITIAPINRWYNKGLDLLLKAWAKIVIKNPKWNLEILGNIKNQKFAKEISNLTTERVKWLDWSDNIAQKLQTKSIFILASRYEGCPMSLIEAMSQGCACIVTNCDGGAKELIDNGINGLIAESENIDDIATKLQLLINNENLRQKLSIAAIEKVKQFDKNAFFANWDNLIEEVTKNENSAICR